MYKFGILLCLCVIPIVYSQVVIQPPNDKVSPNGKLGPALNQATGGAGGRGMDPGGRGRSAGRNGKSHGERKSGGQGRGQRRGRGRGGGYTSNQQSTPGKCLEYLKQHAKFGDAQDVLRVMDEFAWNQTRMINIGDQKGPILRNAVRMKNPLHALELGTFAGYSAISIASEMSRPGAKLISIDSSTNNADFAAQIIHFAGTDTNNKTRVYVGRAETHLLTIMKRENIQRFDFVFLDHDKKVYLSDFMYLLAQKVIGKGTVVVADNMIHPGAPDYLEYVQSQPDTMRTEVHKSVLEYSKEGKEDAVAVTELLK